jgi:hypothetical protein
VLPPQLLLLLLLLLASLHEQSGRVQRATRGRVTGWQNRAP